MMQATATRPSAASCLELLRAMPALTQFRRALYQAAPAEARGWLATLSVLARHPDGLRASQVAELLHIDLSVASRSIAQLLELGYVERDVDPADRRAQLVQASEEGRAWIAAFGDRFATTVSGYLVGWSDAQVHELAELLRRFDASLQEAAR